MGAIMKLDDEIRLNVLSALVDPLAVKPNIHQIKKKTGYHKSTIMSSLDFMQKEGLIQGFGPSINFRKLGFNLEALTLFQMDLSNKQLFDKFLDCVKKDSHVYWFSGMLSSGTYNIVARHLYRDVEAYQRDTQKKYFENIDGIYDLVRDRQVLFLTEPVLKTFSRTKSAIKVIKEEKALE